MLGSSVLDVAIGMIFIYLLFGILCTAFNEFVASALNQRGKNLMTGIRNLLNDPDYTGLAHQIYNHGLIDGISQNAATADRPNRPPSYIPSSSFSLALVDILTTRGALASARNPLFIAAEQADDAHTAAVSAGGKQPSPEQKQAIEQTAQAQKQAEQALTDALQLATSNEMTIRTALAQAPQDANLTQQLQLATHQKDLANAAVKMLVARRAAIFSAKTPNDAHKMQLAADATETALALGRSIAKGEIDPLTTIENAIAQLPNGHTKETLAVLLEKTRREINVDEHALETLRKNLENWFNEAMERVSGWYKRWSQKISLCFACFLVLICNIDTLQIAQRLMNDSALRASLVSAATLVASTANSANTAATSKLADGTTVLNESANKEIVRIAAQNPNLPFGWDFSQWTSNNKPSAEAAKTLNDHKEKSTSQVVMHWTVIVFAKLIGLGISVFAISLGAPFWFDLLIKFVNMRSSGKPPRRPASAATK